MYKNNENTEWTKFQGFTDWEAGKLKRIVEMLVWQLEKGTTKWEKKSRLARERFYAFVNEYDKRRGKDFLKTFPEMKNFYNFCKQLHDESHVTQAGDTEYYHNDESGNRVRQVPVDAKHFYSKPVKSKGYSKA